MINYDQFCQIRAYREEGLKASQIADKMKLDARTVAKWMDEPTFHQRTTTARSSKLDPFKDEILAMLERHPFSAAQIFQKIKELGFDGGITIVRDYVCKVRPKRNKAFLTLSFAPGECAQVDWGSYGSIAVGSTRRRLSFFVMVLCYSRLMYVEFTVSQTMEHFLGCHQRALEYFGGVPSRIMVDNLKSAVLKRTTGQPPVFNPKYLDFARHYGFTVVPCAVGKGNEKGIVENGVGYIKKNFLNGEQLADFAALHPAAAYWLDSVANVRLHAETRQKPREMFAQEATLLGQLPSHPYDIGNVAMVRANSQFRVTLDSNRYSVPAQYAGVRLTLKTYPDRLCIYHDNNLIAKHTRSYDRYQDIEHPDHPKELLAQRKKGRDQQLVIRFIELCATARSYYQGLEERKLNVMHHVRQIVALTEIYPKDQVARAIEDAFEFRAFSCEYIANLLEQRQNFTKMEGTLHLTRAGDQLELTIKEPDISIYSQRS